MRKPMFAVLVLVAAPGCGKLNQKTQTSATEKPQTLSTTHWTKRTELFMEYPALVAAQTARFAVHLTRLDDFTALREGSVEIQLDGPGGIQRFSTAAPSRPGIFGLDVTPARAGDYTMTVHVHSARLNDSHPLGAVSVYPDHASAATRPEQRKQEETIAFLKEQQWSLDFGTEAVVETTGRSSFVAPAEVQPRAGGQAEVAAPLDGRLAEAAAIALGHAVTRGQVLARIAPPASAPADRPALELAKTEAEGAAAFARRDRERAQRLVDAGAVPVRRLDQARLSEHAAAARLKTADSRLTQFEATRLAAGDPAERLFAARAPISGTIVESRAVSGANVRAGDMLFRIVDADTVYVSASIPEAELDRLRDIADAELLMPGGAVKHVGRRVSIVAVVDPRSRTVPVLYEVNNKDRRLAVGQAVSLRLFTSVSRTAPAVRDSAIVDDAGRPVVFVQLAGEEFARRPVTLGNRQGDYVQIASGVKPGDRVVTKGAYLIRLSAMSSQIPAHGHVH